MKLKTIIFFLMILGIVGVVAYLNSRAPTIAIGEKLTVSPQEARTSVKIDQATLTQDGFVAVRGSDGKRLGQIIEISRHLDAGRHKNITVELGDFYEYNPDDQLIAMIYHDDGDKTFSELDQPVNTPAVFVKTGQQVPLSVFEQQMVTSSSMGMETVRYTNTSFQPVKLTVPVGTMVEFVNQSDNVMWVASNNHPEHEILATFDQFKAVEKGQSYMYTFDKTGVWPYHDHINPALEGIIIVE